MHSSILVPLTLFPMLAASVCTPTQDGLVYGTADGETLTMDH
jgi:hypothetical protein